MVFGDVQPNFAIETTDLFKVSERWWRMKRPCSWSLERHLETPTVNCIGNEERKLAKEVARIVKEGDI